MNVRMILLLFTFHSSEESTPYTCDVYWDVTGHWMGAREDCSRKNGSYNYIHNLGRWKTLNSGGHSIDHIYKLTLSGVVEDLCPGNSYKLSNSTSTGCLDVSCKGTFTICNNNTVLCLNKGTRTNNTTFDDRTTAPSTTIPYDVTSAQNSTNTSCNCFDKKNGSKQLGHDELQVVLRQLKAQNAVYVKNLSVRKRKSVSVYDSRSSHVAIGCVAIAFLTTTVCLIIVPDIVSLVRYLNNQE